MDEELSESKDEEIIPSEEKEDIDYFSQPFNPAALKAPFKHLYTNVMRKVWYNRKCFWIMGGVELKLFEIFTLACRDLMKEFDILTLPNSGMLVSVFYRELGKKMQRQAIIRFNEEIKTLKIPPKKPLNAGVVTVQKVFAKYAPIMFVCSSALLYKGDFKIKIKKVGFNKQFQYVLKYYDEFVDYRKKIVAEYLASKKDEKDNYYKSREFQTVKSKDGDVEMEIK
jgi:hypothetical protein